LYVVTNLQQKGFIQKVMAEIVPRGFFLVHLVSVLQTGVMAAAPGDEDRRCNYIRWYHGIRNPPNSRVLMDQYNYINLLPPYKGAVWQQIDNDGKKVLSDEVSRIHYSD